MSGYALGDGRSHAPINNYGAASGPAPAQYGAPQDSLGQYGDQLGSASSLNGVQVESGIEDLKNNIPGVPGEDYPVLAEVPELSFSCEGRVAGGIITFSYILSLTLKLTFGE